MDSGEGKVATLYCISEKIDFATEREINLDKIDDEIKQLKRAVQRIASATEHEAEDYEARIFLYSQDETTSYQLTDTSTGKAVKMVQDLGENYKLEYVESQEAHEERTEFMKDKFNDIQTITKEEEKVVPGEDEVEEYKKQQSEHIELNTHLITPSESTVAANALERYPDCMKFDLATDPMSADSTDHDVLSSTVLAGPCSFYDATKHQDFKLTKDGAVTPTYINYSTLSKPLPHEKDQILYKIKLLKEGGFKSLDEEMLSKQRGVVSDVLKQLFNVMREGKSVVGMSLPVRIFEPRSTLERIVDYWCFAPVFLNRACETKDHMERLRLTVAFAMSGLYVSASQRKPFNPILGETYEGSFPDGSRIYCEHTSHHPPISNFLIIGKDNSYTFWGSYEFIVKIKGNTLHGIQKGTCNLRFNDDGQHIKYTMPKIKLGGIVFGDRIVNWSGQFNAHDVTNNVKAHVSIGPEKKGGLFKKQKGKTDDLTGFIYTPDAKDFIGKDPAPSGKQLEDMSGSWLSNLKIGDETYWDIERDVPSRHLPDEIPLPSDVRYREDVIWLLRGNEKFSQSWKIRLEVQQRWDRKNRLGK
mmetsp:Transcript_47505/g.54691  ORF Transcript_47505/g.54691 Transcript_47505/m.54691 type:complete len:586 (+) Transcript_47505:151-1908(+)